MGLVQAVLLASVHPKTIGVGEPPCSSPGSQLQGAPLAAVLGWGVNV